MSHFIHELTDAGIKLTPAPITRGLFRRLIERSEPVDIASLTRIDAKLLSAIAELRELEQTTEACIRPESIELSHNILSKISDESATSLGLPPTVGFVLKLEVDGVPGSRSFSLRTQWLDGGRRVVTNRNGALLETDGGLCRIPAPMLRAVKQAEKIMDGPVDLASHWEQLALFRNSLDPDATDPETLPDFAQITQMSQFLEGLKLLACSALSIGAGLTRDDFEAVPFSQAPKDPGGSVEESEAAIEGDTLLAFQERFRERGAMPAYRLGGDSFVILTPGVLPLARLMASKQKAGIEERREFINNPEPYIRDMFRRETLEAEYNEAEDVMGAAELEELEESSLNQYFIETTEYQDRVTGSDLFVAPDLTEFGANAFSSTWMPEAISVLKEVLRRASNDDLEELATRAKDSIRDKSLPNEGEIIIDVEGNAIPALQVIEGVNREKEARVKGSAAVKGSKKSVAGPNVLITKTNYSEVDWHPETTPRGELLGDSSVPHVTTQLMPHQLDAVDWTQRAWLHGLPGVLNADEQGLGKTLQTLAFLSWLHTRMAAGEPSQRLPFLVVAPTSLLRNWEAEIETHLKGSTFANVVRLYGSGLAPFRRSGKSELASGISSLDFSSIQTKIDEGYGHNRLFLTTYKTLSNYHHSLHKLRFSVVVFDEIQTLKNPGTIAAAAARSVPAWFRIGLTGTPVENRVQDVWAIMDQLSPGSFGSLKEFAAEFSNVSHSILESLNSKLFDSYGLRPPVAIRRLKENAAADLPAKSRVLLPATMPTEQMKCYDRARVKLAGASGGALKALHHIRSVSTHPALNEQKMSGNSLQEQSARLQQVFLVLDDIALKCERVLVFVEARRLQYQLAEVLAARFQLERVDVINGNTSIPARQASVARFQAHLETDRGFDLLILGPRAAGTGLTLTAANHVVHVSRWWNPAVEEQCNDRVHRIGQNRDVTVHIPMAIHPEHGTASFDCLLQRLMLRKRSLAEDVLAPLAESEGDAGMLQNEISAGSDGGVPPASARELRQWAETRLKEYRQNYNRLDDLSEGDSRRVVTVEFSKTTSASPADGSGAIVRRVFLDSSLQPSVETSRDANGILQTRLSGSLLSLWPEAVIEPGDNVIFSEAA